MIPIRSNAYNFMAYPEVWEAKEWNNQVNGCIIQNRDIGFCQLIDKDDCVNFQFKASTKGENIIVIQDGHDTTTGTTANKVVCSGFGFNTKLAGQIIINTTDNTSTELIAPLNANDAGVTNDIFVSGEDFVLLNARSLVANNWFGSYDGTDYFINKVSDTVNNSQVRIITDAQVTVGQPYRFTFEVSNYLGGQAFVQFGTLIVGYITGNGTYTFYGPMTSTGGITISSLVANDFVGRINLSTATFYELEQQYQLVTMANVPEVLDILGDSFTLNPDTGIVRYLGCHELEAYGDGACIYFGIMEFCQFGNLIPCLPVWTLGPKTEYDGDACQLVLTEARDVGELIAKYLPPCVEEGIEYNISFTVSGLSEAGEFLAGFGGVGGNLGTIIADGVYNYTVEIEDPISDGLQFYTVGESVSVTISEISITVATPIPSFVSECFTIRETCSLQIKFRNATNQMGYDYSDDRYFNFIRLCANLRQGRNKDNVYNAFKNTTGEFKTAFADFTQFEELVITLCPPYLIAAIQVALRHSEVYLNDVRYASMGEVLPNYTDATQLASIVTDVALVDQTDTWNSL